ncbi:MAG TPA: alpha/beta hydrolase [Edaphobacter sp.]|nr:alpha/beta hydrolase [Edaphobacter sp.]
MENARKEIAGFRSESASVNGINIHYWVGGDPNGQPVLLWHGFLGTGYSWHRLMPLIAGAGYRVLVPDMRGYGDSDKPAGDAGYDGAALAEEFRSLVRQTGFGAGRPLTLIAHDMGAPPALLWAAKHPSEISALLYIEAPVMLQSVLEKIITFTPQAMAKGSMWWWILPLAPGVPEALLVGKEREFVNWFYLGDAVVKHEAILPETVNEYLRTFAGVEGVLGSLGVYRTVFATMTQTLPLIQNKVQLPVIAIGGEKGLGARVGQFMAMVAANLESVVLPDCGHFVPEECPEAVLEQLDRLSVQRKP